MAIPANLCVAWPSTAASIPSGWTRETSLDSRYVLGAAAGADADLTTDRGATSHTHTSPLHTPTQNAHTHTFSAADGTADAALVLGTTGGSGADAGHGHGVATSNAATGTNSGVSITVDATANELAYKEVIWIKSDGTPTLLPAGCLAFFASDTLPSGWSRVYGDRYLKGATTGGDGGATGGANTHTHTSPAHTHGQASHSHTEATSGGGDIAAVNKGTGANTISTTGHTHQVSLDAATATNQPVTTTITTGDSEPPYKKLNIINGGASLPTNIIVLWLGTNAALSALTGWSRYTSMDGKWLKGANVDGESDVTTGGSSQHTHTASDCQPVQNAHSHTATASASTDTVSADTGASATFSGPSHAHSTWIVSSDVATNNAVGVTIDNCAADAALPKHRTVIYAQFTGSAPSRPPVTITSYDLNLFDIGNPESELLPEVGRRFAAGDMRYFPR